MGMRPLCCWHCGFESRWEHVCLLCLLRVVRKRTLRRADHSSGGVLPNAVCLCVIINSQPWGGPGPLEGVIPRRKKWIYVFLFYYCGFIRLFHCYRCFIITSITYNATISRSPCYQPVMERQTNVLRVGWPEAKSDNIDSLNEKHQPDAVK